ncbi:internal virion protein [Escherichia phage P694]|uniref:Internal virion protein gp15 n=1 Tax=Escherichia phage P694 TaxID=1572754 RepID=A0A0D3QHG0_9CAUD|nr:internal virion protein [Escherichia phage P694]AJF40528.1 internal core protein [Escherichia phage P694]
MSKLAQALGSMNAPSTSRLRGTGRVEVKASTVYEDPKYAEKSKLIGTVGKLAEMGADAYMKYDQHQKDKADERSNEIIRKLTPEQRREAIKNGTLLYQDDPYAMEALKIKTGRNAAYLVDDEVAQKVKNGEFRTRQELEEFRHSRLQEAAKNYAEQFGIDETDEHYQKGFNSDITERNIALYGAHDNFLSDQAKKGAVINSRVELNSVLNDPETLRSPYAGEFFENYFSAGLTTGSIPSDDQAFTMISQGLSDVVNREGGGQFLQQIENRKVKLHGKETTFKELMGAEQWNNLMVKAQHNEFQLSAKKTEAFQLNVNSALNQENVNTGWEQLQSIKAELDTLQPGEEMTPERQALINAQTQMQDRMKRETAELAKQMDKQQKSMNKMNVIDAQFQKRLNGQYVSTAYGDMPTNENTGEFTHSDMVNYANKKLADIDAMGIPDAQKDRMKLDYLKADSDKGAFRTAVGELIGDAEKEWTSAVINGKMPEDGGVALNALRRVRNADPELFAALYPDKAEMFLTMDMMDNQGIDPQILLDADKARQSLTKEMQYEDDKAWASLMNNSESPEIKYMPSPLQNGARKIYDSVKYRTGNPNAAMQQVDKYLKENTTTLTGDDVDGDTIGVLTRNSLRVTDDPDSWKQGKDIIDTAAKKLAETNPWVTNKQLTVFERGDSIYLMDTTGQVNIRYDKQLLSKMYQENQAKLDEEARNKALKDANKRTLHTRAMNRKREREAKKPKRSGSMYDSVSGKGILDTLTGKD